MIGVGLRGERAQGVDSLIYPGLLLSPVGFPDPCDFSSVYAAVIAHSLGPAHILETQLNQQ